MTPAHDVLAELARYQVRVERHGDRLRLKAPTAPPPDLLDRLKAHKPDVLRLLPDADRRPVLPFRLPSFAANAWAVALGRPGETVESLHADLRERWPGVEVRA